MARTTLLPLIVPKLLSGNSRMTGLSGSNPSACGRLLFRTAASAAGDDVRRPGCDFGALAISDSNTNYFLLAEVSKRATKKSLPQFAAENIFEPLGMMHTRFYDDHTLVVPGRVAAYRPGSGGAFLVDWSTNYDNIGGGGLMSSVDDLLLWDRNFYDNKLGKGTLLKQMQTPGVFNNGAQNIYALGLIISTYRGLPIVDHDGGMFGYRTSILRFPAQRFSALCT